MSFAILLSPHDSQQAEIWEMSAERSVYGQASEVIGDLAEVV